MEIWREWKKKKKRDSKIENEETAKEEQENI